MVFNECERKVAIVTGASSGIGRAMAIEFAKNGYSIAAVGRNKTLLDETIVEIQKIGVEGFPLLIDIRTFDNCKLIVDQTLAKFGKISALINNAGVAHYHAFEEMPPNIYETVIQTNFMAAINLTRNVLPHMINKKSGAIINVSSIHANAAIPNRSIYCATKAALCTWSRSIGMEVKKYGIHVLCVLPGKTESRIFKNFLGTPPKENATPGKMQSSEYVAKETVRALQQKRRELIFTSAGRALDLANRCSHRITDAMVNFLHQRDINQSKGN